VHFAETLITLRVGGPPDRGSAKDVRVITTGRQICGTSRI
jgi:hypothetical protein